MHSQIKKYLYDYFINLKQNKIAEDSNSLKILQSKLSKYVNNYVVRQPHMYGILNGGGDGDFKDIGQKMSDITSIFREYSKLNNSDFVKKTEEIEIKLDEIINLFKSMNINDIQPEDKIINNLDIIRVNAEKFKNGFKINTEKSKLHHPIEKKDLDLVNDITWIENIKKDIDDQNKEIENYVAQNTEIDIEKIGNINRKITDYSSKLTIEQEKIDKLTTTLKEDNNKNKLSFDYKYNSEEVSLIISLPELCRKINSTENTNELLISLKNKCNDKNIKEKDFVYSYNELIDRISGTDLPEYYFNGKYTTRITNNTLMTPSDITEKFKIVQTMLSDTTESSNIYAPNFEHMKNPVTKIIPTRGGALTATVKNLSDGLGELLSQINKYMITLGEYKKEVKIYNILQMQLFTHTLFFVLIITNQLFTTDYVIYDYINRGIITFYIRIVDNIIEKIKNNNNSDEILYLRKYHFVTLVKLHSFLHELRSTIKSNDVIDIHKCKGETANRLLLLNYFKIILESYNETYQNKITIYSRINDIRKVIYPKDDIFVMQKMFMSDYEYAINSDKPSEYKTDHSIMHINLGTCPALKNPTGTEQIKFTEVFDSVNFPENGDISKYMTLDTQLSKGKGVAIMTYGYCGTGKTYTLFGNHSANKEGILQATLDNINGLKSVKFRLYELYGYGLAYPHYWTDDSGKPRKNNINHEIYKYELSINRDSLTYNRVDKIDASSISEYINDFEKIKTGNDTTYIQIHGNVVSDIFRKFDTFMTEIEYYRQGKDKNGTIIPDSTQDINYMIRKRRIRDTPNNIVSSRSVLIYDFELEIGDKFVPFLIIDLPGREELIQTYINPFFDNDVIRDLLKPEIVKKLRSERKGPISEKDIDNNIKQIKLMLAMMMINPIAISVLYPFEVIDIFNSLPDRKSIIETELPFVYHFDKTIASDREKYDKIISKYKVETKENEMYITGVTSSTNNGFKLLDEIINKKGTNLSIFFSTDKNNNIVINKKISLKEARGGYISGYGYLSIDDTGPNYQYWAMIGLHIINRLIMLNRFDIIYNILKTVIDKNINQLLNNSISNLKDVEVAGKISALKLSNFKGELINSIPERDITKEKLKEIVKYDYYLTPLEGIYINENIAGLIKYLGSKMITNEEERKEYLTTLKNEISQSNDLNFQHQQKMARIWLTLDKEKGKDDIHGHDNNEIRDFYMLDSEIPKRLLKKKYEINRSEEVPKLTGVEFNYDAFDETFKNMMESYKSNCIFNFENPLITDILEVYTKIINDYKVFYLFGNYADKENPNLRIMKCQHQHNLLENTKDFIKIITKN